MPNGLLSRNQVLALIAITLVLHTAEEYIAFPIVLPTLAQRLPSWLPSPALHQSMSSLHTALIIGAVIPCLVIVWAIISRVHGFLIASMFIEAVLLVNGIAHTLTAVLARGYVPGLITGLLINLPFGIYAFRRAVNQGWIRDYRAWQLIVAAAVVHVVWLGSAVLRR